MSRRVEAETMLARYGAETVCGGETFRAVIGPSAFRGDGTDGMRYLYFGPAAHKLVPGGSLASGGAEYSVRRCETVLLGGEELYVRALLTRLTAQAGTGVPLTRDGKVFARAESCSAKAVQEAETAVSWGESTPSGIADGAAVWELSLTGIRPAEGADLFSAAPFSVSAQEDGKTVLYTGCRWKVLRREDGLAGDGSWASTALSAGREV